MTASPPDLVTNARLPGSDPGRRAQHQEEMPQETPLVPGGSLEGQPFSGPLVTEAEVREMAMGDTCGECPGVVLCLMSVGQLVMAGGPSPAASPPVWPAAVGQQDRPKSKYRLKSPPVCRPDPGDSRTLQKPVFVFSIMFAFHILHLLCVMSFLYVFLFY